MKHIKFAFNIFNNKLFTNFVLMIQYSAALCICFIMISQYNAANEKAQVFKGLSDIDGGIFSSDYFEFTGNHVLDEIEGNYDVISASLFLFDIDILAFDNEFFSYFHPNINQGKWLSEVEKSADYLPAVLTRSVFGLGLNDIIEVSSRFDYNKSVKIKIVGIQSTNLSIDLNVGGTGITSSDIVQSDSKPRLIVDREAAIYHIGSDYEKITMSSLILTNDQETISNLRNFGYFRSFNEIYESGIEDRNSRVLFFLPFVILLLAVSISGLIGCTTLAAIRNMKKFATLMMIGFGKSDIAKIMVFYLMIISIYSSLLAIIIYFLLINSNIPLLHSSSMLIKMNSFVMPLIFLLTVIFTVFIPLNILKKQQLIEIIRREFY
ncbi:MAG: hypothetical protein FWD44_06965 [Oscillospiraceae bacterium]|nr:hypothetical protein [Oscillospiraceae bacterium]